MGARWLDSKSSLALRVPSAVVPAEDALLITPEHQAFDELGIEGPFDPETDDRLQ
jgi:RES domain-containing protein